MKPISITLTCFLFLSFLCTSCSKTSKKWDKVVFGKIVDSTNNEPMAQTTFVLYIHDIGRGWHMNPSYEEQSFVTDENGNFNVTYNTKKGDLLEIDFRNSPDGGFIWS